MSAFQSHAALQQGKSFCAIHKVALSVALLLAGCGATPSVVTTDPVEQARRLERVTKLLEKWVEAGQFSGVAAQISRHGQVVYRKAVGKTGPSGSTLTPDHIFAIYAMSKPITTVAALMLYEEGHFVLDDPVATYLPEFEGIKVGYWPKGVNTEPGRMLLRSPERPITIFDLLTHTSGLAYPFTAPSGLRSAWKAVWKGPKTLEALSKKIAAAPLVHDPGAAWTYGPSTDVLGRLVETVSGMPFERFLKTRVFGPLKMSDTGFVPTDNGRLMPLEVMDEVTGKLIDGSAPGGEQIREERTQLTRLSGLRSGGAGLYSTLGDYDRFAQMLLGRGQTNGVRLLSPVTVDYMVTNRLPPELAVDPQFSFGLGVQVQGPDTSPRELSSTGSFGWTGAACTYFMVAPELGLTAVLMAQRRPFSSRIEAEFQRTVLQAVVD